MSLRSKIITYTNGNLLFWLLLTAVVAVAFFYMYAVNRTIVMVAQREAVESKIAAYRSEVSDLETAFIAEKSGITMELAQTMGYGEATNVVFVSKKAVSILTRADTIQ